MRLKWMLVSVRLEIVLMLTQVSCTVYAMRTIRPEIFLDAPEWYSLVTRLKWKLDSVCLEILLILTQNRCTVCIERTIGSDVVLDTPDGIPR